MYAYKNIFTLKYSNVTNITKHVHIFQLSMYYVCLSNKSVPMLFGITYNHFSYRLCVCHVTTDSGKMFKRTGDKQSRL